MATSDAGSTTRPSGADRPGRGVTALAATLAAIGGTVVAVIVTLNLHIFVGLEQGYAATPAQVWAFSPLLVVVDVMLLLGGLVGAPLAVVWLRRQVRRG